MREREDSNRTRAAEVLDEIQAIASSLFGFLLSNFTFLLFLGLPRVIGVCILYGRLPLLLLFLSRFTRQHFGGHELPISFSVNLQLGQSAYSCIA